MQQTAPGLHDRKGDQNKNTTMYYKVLLNNLDVGL